jgi:TonB family protein
MAGIQSFRSLIFLTLCLISAEPLLANQSSVPTLAEALQLNQQVVKLFSEGKFDEALPIARRAAELAENAEIAEASQQARAANIIKNLAEIYLKKKLYPDAERTYSRALRLYEKSYGETDPRLCDTLSSLGWMSYANGNTSGAEKTFQRVISIREKAAGADHPDVAAALNNLAAFYEKQGKTDKALPLLQRALAIREAKLQANDLALNETRKRYACALYAQKRMAEANEQWTRAGISSQAPGSSQVTGQVLQGYATFKQQPSYPSIAKAERVQGTALIHVTIDENGVVSEAVRLCGHDYLVEASLVAAKRWRFQPTKVDGKPTKVQGVLTFNFTLQ